MSELRVSLLQTNVVWGDSAANIASVRAMLGDLSRSEETPDMILLPELWTAPFDPGRSPYEIGRMAASEEALLAVSEACGEMGAFALAGSLPWPAENGLAVRCWLVDDRGLRAGYYDKTHLFSANGESLAFAAGSAPLFFELCGFNCSVMTCYDIRFPEFGRSLALCGADVLFVNAAWSLKNKDIWKTLVRALAMHNQLYVAACNSAGRSGELNFCGSSMIVSPWGDILADAGDQELVLSFTLRLSEVLKCRKNAPLSLDRRPDLYQLGMWI